MDRGEHEEHDNKVHIYDRISCTSSTVDQVVIRLQNLYTVTMPCIYFTGTNNTRFYVSINLTCMILATVARNVITVTIWRIFMVIHPINVVHVMFCTSVQCILCFV